MKILFDQGTPAPLRLELPGHVVTTAHEMGWAKLDNGALLHAADDAFDVLITTDQNLRHQQNLSTIRLAIVVLATTSWPKIQRHVKKILDALDSIQPSEIVDLDFPD